jgi:uncharacterized membrane protein YfcA
MGVEMPSSDFQLAEYLLVFALIGTVSGFASGMFGIGGGVLRIPVFVILFPLFGIHGSHEMQIAVATSLALAVPSSLIAVLKHRRLGHLHVEYFWKWGVGLLAGVAIGIAVSPHLPQFALKIAFLVFVLLMVVYFAVLPEELTISREPPLGLARIGLAGGVGAYCVSIGIAGGSLAAPVLKLCGMPMTRALAIGSGTAALVASFGMIGGIWNGWGVVGRPVWALGYVDSLLVAVMLPGALFLPALGVGVASRMNTSLLRKLYAGLLALIAVSMVTHLIAPG